MVLWHGLVHAKKCKTVLWVGKQERLSNSTKYQFHALMTIISKKEELKSVGELSKVCSQIVLKCIYLARIGRPDSLWSVNKFAQSITKWTLTFITHVNTNSIAMWETLPNNADWDCFKTPILQEILRIQNPLLEEHCAFLEVIHWFQSFGCVRNKLQFRTVQQNQKSFLWMHDWGCMVSSHLIYGISLKRQIFSSGKLCCMCLKTTTQWSRWS